MRATGVVRRIDDLGRLVIPKEIRRTMRMREGDPLEIFTGSSGEIVLKKYSIMAELCEFGQSYADSLYKIGGASCVICDTDSVIAFSGSGKKEALATSITKEAEDLIAQRMSYFRQYANEKPIYVYTRADQCAIGIMPIITAGDAVGIVAMLGDSTEVITDSQKKMLMLTATLLANHLEV